MAGLQIVDSLQLDLALLRELSDLPDGDGAEDTVEDENLRPPFNSNREKLAIARHHLNNLASSFLLFALCLQVMVHGRLTCVAIVAEGAEEHVAWL